MKKNLILAVLGIAMVAPTLVPPEADAQRRRDREYRDADRRYSERCRRSNGRTGAIAGGVGGAVIGNVAGGGLLGTVAGGAGGALLGRELDKSNHNRNARRNGC